jgi:hypothetical protein
MENWIAPACGWRTYSITSSARASTDAGKIETERLGGFQIDHQLVLGRRLHRQISRLRSGPYQRNHGACRSGPNVSVLFVQSSDEVAGRSSPGLGLSQIGRQMPALLRFTFLDLICGSASSRAVPPV